jgi:hypothetical protein
MPSGHVSLTPVPLQSSGLTPADLQNLLEWAGARLMALPKTGLKPIQVRVIWPEYSQDRFEVLDHRGGASFRAPIPPAAEITLMEQILLLPNVCEWELARRVLHLRAMVYPISYKYVYSWREIGGVIEKDHKTVKALHLRALREVIKKREAEIARLREARECV